MLWEHQELRTPNEESDLLLWFLCWTSQDYSIILRSWDQLDGVTGLQAVKHGTKIDPKVVSECEAGLKPNKLKPYFSVLTMH